MAHEKIFSEKKRVRCLKPLVDITLILGAFTGLFEQTLPLSSI
jgi:hypothetical protein